MRKVKKPMMTQRPRRRCCWRVCALPAGVRRNRLHADVRAGHRDGRGYYTGHITLYKIPLTCYYELSKQL